VDDTAGVVNAVIIDAGPFLVIAVVEVAVVHVVEHIVGVGIARMARRRAAVCTTRSQAWRSQPDNVNGEI